MRLADLFGAPLGVCLYYALLGLIQASGLAGGFDLFNFCVFREAACFVE